MFTSCTFWGFYFELNSSLFLETESPVPAAGVLMECTFQLFRCSDVQPMHPRSLCNLKQVQELGLLQKRIPDHNQIANVNAYIISDAQISLRWGGEGIFMLDT